jgi:hypothetical protein
MNPEHRMSQAQKLARAGKNQEALEEYVWCFDHGLEYDPDWYCIRGSFLLGDIRKLGDSYPPALAALEERRAALEMKLLADGTGLELVSDLVGLNHVLESPDRTLKLLDKLAAGTPAQRELYRQVLPMVVHELVPARRYEPFLLIREEILSTVEQLLRPPVERNYTIEHAADYYEGLLGCGDTAAAEKVADKLTKRLGNSFKVFFVLAARAVRAGRQDIARLVLKKGVQSLPRDAALPLVVFLDELGQ